MSNQDFDIVLFDGVCNLCNSTVQFIIKHDSKEKFKFASLQSNYAQSILKKFDKALSTPPQSIFLLSNNTMYDQSTAAFRIAQRLDGLWKVFGVLLILPKGFCNFFYQIIAKNRYKWFGKKDACMMPSVKIKSRFLE